MLEELDEEGVRTAARALRAAGVELVAVCFLFSYLNPEHERRAAAIVREELPGAFVTASADVFPQFREFERFTTACMNAFVGPGTGRYLARLGRALEDEGVGGNLHVMMSNGGVASAEAAADKPVTLLLSGPAAGVLGGLWAGGLAGRDRLITFDMGGTSADIGIVTELGVAEASARDTQVAGYPLLVPMIDVHTIGAGGGSIAYVDEGGAFRVGPRSAGALPGPACYGLGGDEPTITDANVVLGRIDPACFLGGEMPLDRDRAASAVGELAARLGLDLLETAAGIVTIANANMARAVRSRTVQKGHDPREFALVAFGGAGPLHACEVADALSIPRGSRPTVPGDHVGDRAPDERSASYDQMRTVFDGGGSLDAARLNRSSPSSLTGSARRCAATASTTWPSRSRWALDCRYAGQGYELRVPLPGGRFDQACSRGSSTACTSANTDTAFRDPIEIVNARVTARKGVARGSTRVPLPPSAGGPSTCATEKACIAATRVLGPRPRPRHLRPSQALARRADRRACDRLPARHDGA